MPPKPSSKSLLKISDNIENGAAADVVSDNCQALCEVEQGGLPTALTRTAFDEMMKVFDEAGDWMGEQLRRPPD